MNNNLSETKTKLTHMKQVNQMGHTCAYALYCITIYNGYSEKTDIIMLTATTTHTITKTANTQPLPPALVLLLHLLLILLLLLLLLLQQVTFFWCPFLRDITKTIK